MLLPILIIFLSTAVPSLAHPVGLNLDIVNERALGTLGQSASLFQNVTHKCGTPGPSDELRQAHADFREQSRQNKEERQASSPIVVPTYVHFVSTIDQSNNYPPNVRNSMITSQVTSLSLLSLSSPSSLLTDKPPLPRSPSSPPSTAPPASPSASPPPPGPSTTAGPPTPTPPA